MLESYCSFRQLNSFIFQHIIIPLSTSKKQKENEKKEAIVDVQVVEEMILHKQQQHLDDEFQNH